MATLQIHTPRGSEIEFCIEKGFFELGAVYCKIFEGYFFYIVWPCHAVVPWVLANTRYCRQVPRTVKPKLTFCTCDKKCRESLPTCICQVLGHWTVFYTQVHCAVQCLPSREDYYLRDIVPLGIDAERYEHGISPRWEGVDRGPRHRPWTYATAQRYHQAPLFGRKLAFFCYCLSFSIYSLATPSIHTLFLQLPLLPSPLRSKIGFEASTFLFCSKYLGNRTYSTTANTFSSKMLSPPRLCSSLPRLIQFHRLLLCLFSCHRHLFSFTFSTFDRLNVLFSHPF